MRIPFISERQPAKLASSLKRADGVKTGKVLAREKQKWLDMCQQRETARKPQPYHIMPELNILGLWKWF